MAKQDPSLFRQSTPKASFPLKPLVFWLFFACFVGGGLFSGVVSSPQVLGLVNAVASVPLGQRALPFNIFPSSATGPDWNNNQRVNVLVMGIDRRGDEGADNSRTDVMMVMTIDPASKSAGMLSIPRDLYVPIPVRDNLVIQERINTANVYGEYYKYPGGGVALAKSTVQYNFGIPIHYYLLVDFDGFLRLIDTIGGVTVDVEKQIVDYEYPTPNYGTMTIRIPEGIQHFDGEHALWYVRSRHQDSDFSRMKRQQKVLLAIRDQLLQLNMILRLPQLWREFKDVVQTDLALPDLLALANVARNVDPNNIISRSLEIPYVTNTITSDGAYILLLNRALTKEVIDEVFFDAHKQQQAARIEVLNGTDTVGLATKTAKQLEEKGFNQVTTGDSLDGVQDKTQIYSLSTTKYSAGLIASILNFPTDRVQTVPKMNGGSADIRVVLGKDALAQAFTGTAPQP